MKRLLLNSTSETVDQSENLNDEVIASPYLNKSMSSSVKERIVKKFNNTVNERLLEKQSKHIELRTKVKTTDSNLPSEFLIELKNLNSQFSNFISMWVAGDPYVDFSPVIEDYMKHILSLKEKHGILNNENKSNNNPVTTKSEAISAYNNTFSNFSQGKDLNTISSQPPCLLNSSCGNSQQSLPFFQSPISSVAIQSSSKIPPTTSTILPVQNKTRVSSTEDFNFKAHQPPNFRNPWEPIKVEPKQTSHPSGTPNHQSSHDSITTSEKLLNPCKVPSIPTDSFSVSNVSKSLKESSSLPPKFSFTSTIPSFPFSQESTVGNTFKPSLPHFGSNEQTIGIGTLRPFKSERVDEPSSLKPPTFVFKTPEQPEQDKDECSDDVDNNEEENKNEVINLAEEPDAFYTTRVKLLFKRSNTWIELGVGLLNLKKVGDDNSGVQIVVRVENSQAARVLMNILIMKTKTPISKNGKTIILVSPPNPTIDTITNFADDLSISPACYLIRLKSEEDANTVYGHLS